MTEQEIEDRFDGYPVDCIIQELLEAEAENKRLREALEEIAENSSCFVALVTATEALNENKNERTQK